MGMSYEDYMKLLEEKEMEQIKIIKHKEEFPKFKDIEEFTGPEWISKIIKPAYMSWEKDDRKSMEYLYYKLAYENGLNVTWKLKEKIDRRLHVNKELAQAVGEWLVVNYPIQCDTDEIIFSISQYGLKNKFTNSEDWFYVNNGWINKCTLNKDWPIPQSVIDRMNELKEQNKQD